MNDQNQHRPSSLKISRYRCFADLQGFDSIQRINLIVGRNNSGKSSLLDAVRAAVEMNAPRPPLGQGEPTVQVTQRLPESVLRQTFPSSTSGGQIGGNHWEYGSRYIGKDITWRLQKKSGNKYDRQLVAVDNADKLHSEWNTVTKRLADPFGDAAFIRLSADRDVVPEGDFNVNLSPPQLVSPTGQRATAVINEFIQDATLPRDLVEVTMLDDLNRIFAGDGHFERIQVQRNSSKQWEVFLDESTKGRVSLSDSGHGLKTVVLVLVLLRLLPAWSKSKSAKSAQVFAFEELENNLHPSLVRRLLDFIVDMSKQNESWTFFLTTHSSAAIDLLSQLEDVSITHVVNGERGARAEGVSTYLQHRNVLDDLGVRASDVLQANSIIWVEGESDRAYIKTWIGLATSNRLKEGVHYQCLEYGGKNLSHFGVGNSATVEDQALGELVDMLRVNRNAVVVMDSDIATAQGSIRSTKQRVCNELVEFHGLHWVTDGREIENYLPAKAVGAAFDVAESDAAIEKFEKFSDFHSRLVSATDTSVPMAKVEFARRVAAHLKLDQLVANEQLSTRIVDVVAQLCRWNELDQEKVLASELRTSSDS